MKQKANRKNATNASLLTPKEQKIRLNHARYREKNRLKIRARSKKWYLENIPKARNRHLLDKYDLSLDQYNELLKSQNNMCAICSRLKPNQTTNNLHVDHCHKTGKIRGLLCDKCNRGLGFFSEDISLFQKAIEYVKKHQ